MGAASRQRELKQRLAEIKAQATHARQDGAATSPAGESLVARPSRSRSVWATNTIIARRYKEPYVRRPDGVKGPLYLDTFDQAVMRGAELSRGKPYGCGGPAWREVEGWGPYPCHQELFCSFCWQADRELAGLQSIERHTHGGPITRFSITLPTIRDDLEAVRDARQRFVKVVKEMGWTHYLVWIHAFGKKPFEGPKGHLDGILSAPEGEDPMELIDVLREPNHGIAAEPIRDAMEYAFTGPATRYDVDIDARRIDLKAEGGLKDLRESGMYSGRNTFQTLSWIAGQADRAGQWFRFTNIDGRKVKDTSDILTHEYPGGKNGYVPRDKLIDLQVTASQWERRTGAPMISRKTTHVPGTVQVAWEAVDGHRFWRHRKPNWL